MANYQSKEEIQRQPLKNHFLKRVILRCDYTSIVDMQKVLNAIVAYLEPPRKHFQSFNQMVLQSEEEMPKMTGDANNSTVIRPAIYRFSDCLIEPIQNVTLDVAREYICLDIRCNENYTKIDSYLEMMARLISIIIENEAFVQLNRLGIRKINGVEIDTKKADAVFEYFTQQLDWGKRDILQARQYTDYMLCHDILAFVTYNRIVRSVSNSRDLRFTLDIDCYKDTNFLERRPKETSMEFFLKAMNKKLFDLFKMSIKLDYLNQNL